MNRRSISAFISILLFLTVILSGCSCPDLSGYSEPSFPDSDLIVRAKVVRVKDGDTFVARINGEDRTIRLIGVDTPESVHPDKSRNTNEGRMVSHYVSTLLYGKDVWLEFDVAEADRYSRLLCYCWFDDKTMLNADLLKKGYALTMTVPPNVKYEDYFASLQAQARENERGLWKNFFKGEDE